MSTGLGTPPPGRFRSLSRMRRADGRLQPGKLVLMTGMGAGLTWGSALIRWTKEMAPMSKIAFCFPGQGSIEAGMGRDIADAVPGGERRVRARQRGVRPRPRAAVLPRRRRGARRHRGAAAGARRDVARDARGDPRPRHRAGLRRRPFGRRVRGARRGGRAVARGRDRARARARHRDGGGRAPASRLDGRDPRARGRGRRDAVPPDPRRVACELQLPRARSSSRASTSPSTSASSARRRKAPAAPSS